MLATKYSYHNLYNTRHYDKSIVDIPVHLFNKLSSFRALFETEN